MSKITDKPSGFAHPSIRAIYNFLTWLILSAAIAPGKSLFVGLFMLGCGLFFDYAKTNPEIKIRKFTKKVGQILSGSVVLINLVALLGFFIIKDNSNIAFDNFPFFKSFEFSAGIYWAISGFTVVWTIADWVAEYVESSEESQIESQNIEGN